MSWTVLLVVVGAVLPIVVAVTTIIFGTGRVPGGGGLGVAFGKGIALGTAGGLVISAIVIAVVLGLRALR